MNIGPSKEGQTMYSALKYPPNMSSSNFRCSCTKKNIVIYRECERKDSRKFSDAKLFSDCLVAKHTLLRFYVNALKIQLFMSHSLAEQTQEIKQFSLFSQLMNITI